MRLIDKLRKYMKNRDINYFRLGSFCVEFDYNKALGEERVEEIRRKLNKVHACVRIK